MGCVLGFVAAWMLLRSTPDGRIAVGSSSEDIRPAARSSGPTITGEASQEPTRRPEPAATPEPYAPGAAASEAKRAASTLVYGRLLETDGTPIRDLEGTWVVFTDRMGARHLAGGGQGEYAIGGLAPGRYVIDVNARGIRSHSEILDLPLDPRDVRKDLRLLRVVTLPVHVVTATGEPLLDALRSGPRQGRGLVRQFLAVATKDPPGRCVDEIAASSAPVGIGYFTDRFQGDDPSLPATCIGTLFVDGELPVHVSLAMGRFVLRTERVEPGAEDARFVLGVEDVVGKLASLQVQVVDATTSAPIEAAGVLVRGWPQQRNDAQTNSKGVARIDPTLPGTFEVCVMHAGYQKVVRTIDLDPGGAVDLGTITLSPERILSATVLDADGKPVSIPFTLGELSDSSHGRVIVRPDYLQSSAEGILKGSMLGRSVYVLRTTNHDAIMDKERSGPTDVSRCILVDTSTGSVSDLEVRLERSVPLVVRVAGRPADGLRLRVLDDQGLPIVETRFYGEAPHPLRLPSGSYRVVLCDADGNELASSAVTLVREPVELALSG